MAKIRPGIIKISGTIDGVTHVYRRDGSHHVRSARGTIKKAKLNTKMQSSVNRNTVVNTTAMAVNNSLKPYSGNFKEGAFWSNLLSRIRLCVTDDLATHLESLAGLELNYSHTFNKVCPLPDHSIHHNKENITVTLTCNGAPDFGKYTAGCYRFDLVLITWNKNAKKPLHTGIATDWNYFEHKSPVYELVFRKTSAVTHYLLVLKIEAGNKGKPEDMMWGTGMKVLGGGRL